jgi:serine/threonine protein phosphatase PrpC
VLILKTSYNNYNRAATAVVDNLNGWFGGKFLKRKSLEQISTCDFQNNSQTTLRNFWLVTDKMNKTKKDALEDS